MNQGISFATLGGMILFFILYLILGFAQYRKANSARYSFFNCFPYELSEGVATPLKNATVSMGGLFVLSELVSLILINTYSWPNQSIRWLAVLSSVFGAISLVSEFFMALLPAKYNKAHIFTVVAFFVSSSVHAISFGIALLSLGALEVVAQSVIGVILIVLGCINLFLMIDPRFANWAKLTLTTIQDGTVEVTRPKRFILAYSEWIVVVVELLACFLGLLALLLG